MLSVAFVLSVGFVVVYGGGQSPGEITDAQLTVASAGRTVRLGQASGGGQSVTIPLEVYVARVLAGEAEPRAAQAAHEAVAIAIRTFALFNERRHARDGFDLCDSTHCQVPRAATQSTRRAAMATAGRILMYQDRPAELFYSASCGGYSEAASEVWPGADYPYLQVSEDDVHDEDVPWVLTLTVQQVQRALVGAGFSGRLNDVDIEERNESGRVALMSVSGMTPSSIRGEQFRNALGTTSVRSTAFDLERSGDEVRLTGRGYGHGVGMCVIGAGRRAARGETAEEILTQYYPGLALVSVGGSAPVLTRAASTAADTTVLAHPGGTVVSRGGVTAVVPPASAIDASTLEQLTTTTHARLSMALGVSVAPITVRLHDTLEAFRGATGQPWWVSSVARGTSIDLAPLTLLDQREGLDVTLRRAVAELLVAEALHDRPRWVRLGASRYFARGTPPEEARDVPCPADAELTLAISAAAQREAEARAESCFVRRFARVRDWRAVR